MIFPPADINPGVVILAPVILPVTLTKSPDNKVALTVVPPNTLPPVIFPETLTVPPVCVVAKTLAPPLILPAVTLPVAL